MPGERSPERRPRVSKREDQAMAKSIADKLESVKKWLDRNAQNGLAVKPAQSALANAEKAIAEAAALKAKMSEAIEARNRAFSALEASMLKVKAEKKLRAKEAKVQAKLAALSSSS
jgi:hypothetical protein